MASSFSLSTLILLFALSHWPTTFFFFSQKHTDNTCCCQTVLFLLVFSLWAHAFHEGWILFLLLLTLFTAPRAAHSRYSLSIFWQLTSAFLLQKAISALRRRGNVQEITCVWMWKQLWNRHVSTLPALGFMIWCWGGYTGSKIASGTSVDSEVLAPVGWYILAHQGYLSKSNSACQEVEKMILWPEEMLDWYFWKAVCCTA